MIDKLIGGLLVGSDDNAVKVDSNSAKVNNKFVSKIGSIYEMNAIKRSFIIWLSFQFVLWITFLISYITHREAWSNVIQVDPSTAAVGGVLSTFLFIVINNLIVCTLIVAGNLFARFSVATPGLLVLFVQAIMIGWLAGSNGFEVPFLSVKAANIQFLKIGLWETTAYALACAITLPKSLNISDTFPAKKWTQTRRLKDIKLNTAEIWVSVLATGVLVIAAAIEAFMLCAS
jgi:uncharacterized membrane protein SpoIIM required for sporulation